MIIKKLIDPVSKLKGVGKKREQALKNLGIYNINDLLTYYPFRYDDFQIKQLSDIKPNEKITLKGIVIGDVQNIYYGYKQNRTVGRINVQNKIIKFTFFNQPWLSKKITTGKEILIYGRYNDIYNNLVGIKVISTNKYNKMSSIYSVNKSIHQSTINQLVKLAYSQYKDLIYDYVPEYIRNKYKLEHELNVIHDMHFPINKKKAWLARRTAKFNEFFLYQMHIQLMKQYKQSHLGVQINYKSGNVNNFIKSLPFKLTDAQNKVIQEIIFDLKCPKQMNRLLQGDVGSGKTVVAAVAIYAVISNGFQAVLMAPTEILAEQHANTFAKLFKNFPINIALLTGDTKEKARKELLPHIKNGDMNLIIGTQALFQSYVKYNNLGLIIVDEQHRFGVNQRKALMNKGNHPNSLAMTATPIPRTLAVTSYGEMDISIIDELPAGRKPIKTNWIRDNQVNDIKPFLIRHLNNNEQIYIVAPLIKQNDSSNMVDATNVFQKFKKIFGLYFNVGLIHGRMKDSEKNHIMQNFKEHKIQILISTTVIEVGVDVSNATLMMIYNADHFGLAQLHQLRGRVGRGTNQSYCILVASPKSKLGVKRMQAMVKTNNGFVISQQDLKLRGPGDVIGQQQSGIPNFKVGDPIADLPILNVAKQEAINIVSNKNWESKDDNINLINKLNTKGIN